MKLLHLQHFNTMKKLTNILFKIKKESVIIVNNE